MRSIAKVNNSLACLFAVIYIVGGNRDRVFAWYLKGARRVEQEGPPTLGLLSRFSE